MFHGGPNALPSQMLPKALRYFTAPIAAPPLPGNQASAAMIAMVMTSKYVDGTPLYRMEDALGRVNIPVSRATLGH
jgi:transposase